MANSKTSPTKPYKVYVLLCADGTLYTGVTNDLDARLVKHNQGKGAKYTRNRTPVKLIYSEDQPDRSAAQKREYEIKSWSREQKIDRLHLSILTI